MFLVRAVASAVKTVVKVVSGLYDILSQEPNEQNPTMGEIQSHIAEAERRRRDEEERIRREETDRRHREYEERRQREDEERRRRDDEDRERRRREDDDRRRRDEEDRRRRDEEDRRVREDHERRMREEIERSRREMEELLRRMRMQEDDVRAQDAEAKRMEEEVAKMEEEVRAKEREAQEAQERARVAEEASRRREEEAMAAAAEAQREADEAKRRQEQFETEEQARRLQEDEKRAMLEQQLAETMNNLEKGIRPLVWPTKEEFEAAKVRLRYRKDLLHFAVCGPSGSGKSSLINAFRGLKPKSSKAAPVGVVETTTAITRYPDARQGMPYQRFVWYDVPGAGTFDIPSWQYFNQQGLFIFDFIILVYDAVSHLSNI